MFCLHCRCPNTRLCFVYIVGVHTLDDVMFTRRYSVYIVGVQTLDDVMFTLHVSIHKTIFCLHCKCPYTRRCSVYIVGVQTLDDVLLVFCSTGMLVGGVTAFFLDNTIPGRGYHSQLGSTQ